MEIGPELLGHTEVYDYAARIRLSPRTVERYTAAGVIDRPSVPGRGQGRGRAGWWRPEVLAQLDALKVALCPRAGLAVVLHRLWWDGRRPDLYEDWQRNRRAEIVASLMRYEADRALSDAELESRVDEYAAHWGHRKWPYRSHMRGELARETLAGITINMALRRSDRVLLTALIYSGGPTIGDLLRRAFGPALTIGLDHLQAQGWELRESPEALAFKIMSEIPPPAELLVGLAFLPEPIAAMLRDAIKDCETGPTWPVRRPARDLPAVMGHVLATLAVSVRRAANLPAEQVTCPTCGTGFTASASVMEATCPGCGDTCLVVVRWPL